MFDLSWGEMMLIGAVALIVIGPKDLPRTLRAVGQAVGKVKRMASEFQGQFNQAMREAELDSVRKEVEGINRAAQAGLNPAKAARDEIKRAIDGKPTIAKPASAAAPAAPGAAKVDIAKPATAVSAAGATAITTDAAAGSTTASSTAASSAVATTDPGAVAAPAAARPVPPAPEPVPVADREEAKP